MEICPIFLNRKPLLFLKIKPALAEAVRAGLGLPAVSPLLAAEPFVQEPEAGANTV